MLVVPAIWMALPWARGSLAGGAIVCVVSGLVALIGRQDEEPLSPLASDHCFALGPTEGREAVHDGDADLDFGGLAVGVS